MLPPPPLCLASELGVRTCEYNNSPRAGSAGPDADGEFHPLGVAALEYTGRCLDEGLPALSLPCSRLYA
jgi:hypothetical protein